MTERRGKYNARPVDLPEVGLPLTLTFEWPDDTSLNARMHWSERSMRQAGSKAFANLYTQYTAKGLLPIGEYQARYTFHPPNHRYRDLDNMLARLKPTNDGMCEALGIDDSAIRRVTLEWGDSVPDGRVVVTITRLEGHE